MAFDVIPFAAEHIKPAVSLLLARNAAHAAAEPAVGHLDAGRAADAVRSVFNAPEARGVFGSVSGEPTGFLLTYPVLGGPDDLEASDYPPHCAAIPSHGHAVNGPNARDRYRELYAALAEVLVGEGHTAHRVTVPATDRDVVDAWFSLEFGLHEVTAVRPVEPVPAAPSDPDVGIRRFGVEAIDDAVRFCNLLDEHLARSPSFFPLAPGVGPAWRAVTVEQMAKPENAYFFAYRDGRAVGMASFMEPWALSPAAMPERCVYLDQGVVEPSERGGGVGRALLAAGMNWARGEGFAWCALDYVSSNLTAARFWERAGFRPLEYRLARQVDQRIVEQRG